MATPLENRVARLERKVDALIERNRINDALAKQARTEASARAGVSGRRYGLAELVFAAVVGASSVASTIHLFVG